MNTATLGKPSELPATIEKRFSLHEFLDTLLPDVSQTDEATNPVSTIEITKLARASRREYLRTQRSLGGY